MGRAGAARQGPDRRARVAAQRAAARRTQTRNRLLLAGGAIVVVLAVVLSFVLLRGSSGSQAGAPPPAPTGAALSQVVTKLTTVPASTLDQVGAGQASSKPTSISGTPLMSGGKPEVLYMGAEYCPYCAAERWAMIVALSRFGTLHGLATTHSASKDGAGNAEPYPNTPTWTFVHASFTSSYLAFTPVEMQTNIPDPSTGSYTTLQTPTAEQQANLNKYDAAYQGAIPFLNFGNKYLSVGASYDPGVLSGLTWSQIAADLHNPGSPVAKSVLGTANYLTAAMCRLTGGQPATACTPTVQSLQGQI